jgi:hypothetical protein
MSKKNDNEKIRRVLFAGYMIGGTIEVRPKYFCRGTIFLFNTIYLVAPNYCRAEKHMKRNKPAECEMRGHMEK